MPGRNHKLRLTCCLLTMALTAVALAGCDEVAQNAYTGTVEDDVFEVQVPALVVPRPNVTAWEPARGAQAAGGSQALTAAATSGQTRSRVTSAPVAEGDRVEAGDVVAILDDSLLRAALVQAKAAAKRSSRDVGVVEQRIDDVASGKATVAEKRADVVSTIGDLQRTRADLVAKRADAKAALAQLERIPLPPPGSTPPTLPPGTPDPRVIRANIAKLRAGIAQIDAALVRIDSGLAQARSGLARIDSAREDLNDAQAQLSDLGELAEIGADASLVAVDLVQAQLDMATLRAPVDGVVVSAARVGSVLAPGAPVAIIRADGPRRIRIWIPPDRIGSIEIGDRARVSLDSFDASFPGRVSRLGVSAGFPPTSLATSEIHLTRAIEAEITLDSSELLPPGVPADVALTR